MRVPRVTAIEPRWTSVAVWPKGVWIDTVFPPVGTVPAKVTRPSAGASTSVPARALRSTPRCWPAAYGCARSKEKGRSTGPSTGQVHACALATGNASAQSATRATANRRDTRPPVVSFENSATVARRHCSCQYWLQGTAVKLVARHARQARDHIRGLPPRQTGPHELADCGYGRVRVCTYFPRA
jgi:hypothetical protein